MIRVRHLHGPLWGIESTSFSKVLNEEAKRTPGMKFIPETRIWQGYADAVHVTAKRAHARGLNIQGQIDAPIASGLLAAKKGLRGYQKFGVDFLIAKSSEGCILADELGLGKTMQAITAARALRQKTIVLCPNFGRGVWLDEELPRWWPAAKVIGLVGIKPTPVAGPLNEQDVAVVHFEILYAWTEALIAWGARTLIIDEGQAFAGLEARRSIAARKLAAVCSHRMMLTGTPIRNRIKDLWGPMQIISPGRFGDEKQFFKFGFRYCDAHEEQIEIHVEGVKVQKRIWKFDGESNIEELHERLTYSEDSPWGSILRRLKSEVNLELPARQRQIITVEVSKSHIASIRSIKSDGILRNALNLAADGKYPQVIDLAVSHLEAGQKIVVGAYRRKIVELIADGIKVAGKRVEFFHGDTPLAKRQALIKSKPDCLCVTLDSTAGAINLSFASVGIIAELIWDPSKLLQWEGRFGRFEGSNILIQYMIARSTADDLVKKIVIDRLGTSQRAIGKTDDKLDDDLRGLAKEGAADRMRRLYEKLIAEDAA